MNKSHVSFVHRYFYDESTYASIENEVQEKAVTKFSLARVLQVGLLYNEFNLSFKYCAQYIKVQIIKVFQMPLRIFYTWSIELMDRQ